MTRESTERGTRRRSTSATIRTTHADDAAAAQIADAVRPDNTAEMDTRVDGATIETTILRETTGGLRSTADDYVVNLRVAEQLTEDDADAAGTDTADTDTAGTDAAGTDAAGTDAADIDADDIDADDTDDTNEPTNTP